jgi:predicted Asp-tRNA(Asn)/Glu-tRNA(Gln) amidotransferase subunit C
MDKEKIQKQAKEILETFAQALEKVEKESHSHEVIRKDSERKEHNGKVWEGFKDRMLANAPRKNNDFIIAEKGEWKG